MAKLSDTLHTAAYLVSEAVGSRAREEVSIEPNSTLKAGQVLCTLANGNYAAFDQDGTTPVNAATAICYADVTTGASAGPGVAHVRDCEVRGVDLLWPADIEAGEKTTAIAALAAFGIIVR